MIVAAGLRNALGFVKRAVGYRSLSTASLIQRNLPHVVVPLRPEGGRIVADAIGLSLDPQRHAYYLPALPEMRDLVRQGGGSFTVDENGDPEYRVGGLRLTPQGRDDLYVLHETFAKRLYELHDGREWFVLDIGMNVGYVALYFAGILGWETLAYEPFPKTFDLAVENIKRNGLANRIDARLAGVAGRSERMAIAFNEEARSTNGLFGNLQADRKTADTQVEIEIQDAAAVVVEAIAKAGERPLLVKLDCEGAEYDILDRLAERRLLDRVDAYVIEYHFILPEHSAERIKAPLIAAGYLLKTLWTGTEAEGILAVRRAPK